MPQRNREEVARRIRAARAYADLPQSAFAELLHCTTATVRRIENGQREMNGDELEGIARLCGVPMAFLEQGFDHDDVEDTRRRLAEVERGLAELRRKLS
jgi:transcriptional regulator with XRE-family HTH domain